MAGLNDSFLLPASAIGKQTTALPLTTSTQFTGSHNVGSKPVVLAVFEECVIAELGYNIGDRVFTGYHYGNAGNTFGFSTTVDEALLSFACNVNTAGGSRINRTTPGGTVVGTAANWRVVAVPLTFLNAPVLPNI